MAEKATDWQTFEGWGKNVTSSLTPLLKSPHPPSNMVVSRPMTIYEHSQESINSSTTTAHLQAAHRGEGIYQCSFLLTVIRSKIILPKREK